jgi:cytochrome c oxidase subunit 3
MNKNNILTKLKYYINCYKHPFHLVKPSPWPLLVALSIGEILIKIAIHFHSPKMINFFEGHVSFFIFPIAFILWFCDITFEATHEGEHTKKVQKGLKMAMLLFIVSEIFFFFSFFWTFFHCSISPSIWIGCQWPPLGIQPINPFGLPLLNTVILLSSGVSVTYAHRAIIAGYRKKTLNALLYTIFLGVLFTLCQLFEYYNANFAINDSIYGSIFYLITGFHGAHVIIGTIFLFICLLRHIRSHFSKKKHLGLVFAIWYWHFVDVVWLFLFIFVYLLI